MSDYKVLILHQEYVFAQIINGSAHIRPVIDTGVSEAFNTDYRINEADPLGGSTYVPEVEAPLFKLKAYEHPRTTSI